ncbi:hypothetical protein KNE206_60920 [Kitasatospora sp. NE20-6]|uniref:hypothetical protein n=1 Tax=Kitasatospora sp. NE20-6 TaxID=2859066 RepID=UPI0034DC74AE
MESLRTLLEAVLVDGRADLPGEDDGVVSLSLEALVALWGAARARDRMDGIASPCPERTWVEAESSGTMRAVLRVGGCRYRVDVLGRVDTLCFVAGCPNDSIGPRPLQTCEGHLDHPGHAPHTTAPDPVGLTVERVRAWRERTDLAREQLYDDEALLGNWEAVVERLVQRTPETFGPREPLGPGLGA